MIGLVNVVAGEKVVPELIQSRANPGTIAHAALDLWRSAEKRSAMQAAFKKIRRSLGEPGASARAASAILAELDQRRMIME